jgi:hypothetical protein
MAPKPVERFGAKRGRLLSPSASHNNTHPLISSVRRTPMPEKLKDKVALVTGGSSGMGLAAAELFVDNGALFTSPVAAANP